ncbi:hypothetical protein QEP73_18165 [Pseudomonas defluvii]|nr:hypothetical protein QEP73_18165 [Pseudomonas defluvii]
MNTQRTVLWLVFLGVAAAAAWAPGHWFEQAEQDMSEPVATVSRSPAQVPVNKAIPAHSAPLAAVDLFASKSWKPAAVLATVTEAPVAVAPVEALPVPPALPFHFVGRLQNRDDQQVFLQSGEKLYVVRQGDVIDDTYRIEQISATELSLVYLPMQLSQTLSVGSAQ